MDPFENRAERDRQREYSKKQKCENVAKKICNEIKNNGALRGIIDQELKKSNLIVIRNEKIPRELIDDFRELSRCDNYKEIVDNELNKASKYLRVTNAIEHCNEGYSSYNVPGLSILYNHEGKFTKKMG
jgi:hypothetical protein